MFFDTLCYRMKSLNKDKLYQKKQCDFNTALVGTVTVWSKGQVVIPKEVREELDISEWDKLMVLTKHGMAIGLIKSDNVPEFLSYMQQEIEEDARLAA